MQLERTSPFDPRWYEFVAQREDATIFHRPEWSGLLAEAYDYTAFAVIATEFGRTIAGAPFLAVGRPFRRRWSCLPFTDRCGPLGDDRARSAFVDGLGVLAARDRISTVELRAGHPGPGNDLVSAGVRHTLALGTDATAVLRRMSSAHARNARHAERAGVTVSMGTTVHDVRSFYELHVRTRRRLGVPVQPVRFFRLLARRIIGAGLGFVGTARLGDRPLASAVFLRSGPTLIYKYGASDERTLSHRPNDLLFREVIAMACREGYQTLDFGRSDTEDAGLRRFKSSFGAEETPLMYTHVGSLRPPDLRRAGRLLAPLIRRSSPAFCRALGEALYRYSA